MEQPPRYELWRISSPDRIHVATFDSIDPEADNRLNCQETKRLLNQRPGMPDRYECELFAHAG
jgi:hypothetical protein